MGRRARSIRPPPRSALPPATTPFVGRHAELAELARLLADPACRLLTLLGPGGIGKTRLALEAAARQAAAFGDGVVFVALQPVTGAEAVAIALAEALGLPRSRHTEPTYQLRHFLHDKVLLLVLDSLERLLASANLLVDLLQQAPALKLLITSRVALQVRPEWRYPVAGLAYPTEDDADRPETFGAVQLFAERARRVRWDFSLQEQKTEVVRICRLVAGHPLALELAAAWTRTLPCAVIAEEIARSVAFLHTDWQDLPPRHRSLHAVFAQSWQRLDPEAQAVLARLSVFESAFAPEAAQQVAGASAALLATLVDHSLLTARPDGRYQLHALLRQYAGERLHAAPAEAARVQAAHGRFYTRFLGRHTAAMRGGGQQAATAAIAAELADIRAAWAWAVAQREASALDAAAVSFSLFCQFQSRYQEGEAAFARAVASLRQAAPTPETQRTLAECLTHQGWLLIRLGQLQAAATTLQQSQALLAALPPEVTSRRQADPLPALGVLALVQGAYAEAARLGALAREQSQARGDQGNVMFAWHVLSNAALAQGDLVTAQHCACQAFAVAEATDNRWFLAYCHNNLGHVARALGDMAAARRHYQASYALRQAFADPEGMAVALHHLGWLALQQGEPVQARPFFAQSVALYQGLGDRGGLAAAHIGLGYAAAASGALQTARAQFAQALQQLTALPSVPLRLAIVLGIGALKLHTGQTQQGLALIAWVGQHPLSDHDTRSMAQRLLGEAGHPVSPAPVELETLLAAWRVEWAAAEAPTIPPAFTPLDTLTPRELEVLRLLAGGLSNPDIAARLAVAPGTVKAHTHRIYSKLGVRNRLQAVTRARELHLL
ncbi:MAG: hypothetical protein KatS3mg131_3504 [Candidatus Tectimicrobiota bacterium]|nr:MAG: hypothetical protein KatS3mg131_3504 [Candidatus Tectomicrobia bacterium]